MFEGRAATMVYVVNAMIVNLQSVADANPGDKYQAFIITEAVSPLTNAAMQPSLARNPVSCCDSDRLGYNYFIFTRLTTPKSSNAHSNDSFSSILYFLSVFRCLASSVY
jgi:hypothetical protein